MLCISKQFNMNITSELERHALRIPEDDRLRLAAKLLASVPGSSRATLSQKDAVKLAVKRAEELDEGKVKGLNYRNEMKRIRELFSR